MNETVKEKYQEINILEILDLESFLIITDNICLLKPIERLIVQFKLSINLKTLVCHYLFSISICDLY